MNSEKKVVDYQVVMLYHGESVPLTIKHPSNLWEDGWQPWGSPTAGGKDVVFQAFVKYES